LCTRKHGRSTYYTFGWFFKDFTKWDSTPKPASVHGETSVKYLDHIISQGKLMVDKEKVKAIQEWKRPETTKQLQQFLRLVNYYREFI
jgi:hypothetical protein